MLNEINLTLGNVFVNIHEYFHFFFKWSLINVIQIFLSWRQLTGQYSSKLRQWHLTAQTGKCFVIKRFLLENSGFFFVPNLGNFMQVPKIFWELAEEIANIHTDIHYTHTHTQGRNLYINTALCFRYASIRGGEIQKLCWKTRGRGA